MEIKENTLPKILRRIATENPKIPAQYSKDKTGKFQEFLEAIFRNNNVILFIGYGLNEFEIMDYIVTKAGHSQTSPQKVYVK